MIYAKMPLKHACSTSAASPILLSQPDVQLNQFNISAQHTSSIQDVARARSAVITSFSAFAERHRRVRWSIFPSYGQEDL